MHATAHLQHGDHEKIQAETKVESLGSRHSPSHDDGSAAGPAGGGGGGASSGSRRRPVPLLNGGHLYSVVHFLNVC